MYYKNKQGKSKSMMGILVGIIVLGLVITGYFLYFQTEELSQIEVIEKEPIKIAITAWPGTAYAFIAQEKGFFERNGVDVDFVFREKYSEQQELFRRGDVDGVFTLIHDTILYNDEGINSKIVHVADYSEEGDVIVGRSEFDSLADLKGKTISFEGFNSFSHVFVLQAIEKAGLKESDVSYKNIPGELVTDALEEGRIDAGQTWGQSLSDALEKGYKILVYAKDVGGIVSVTIFNSEIVEERPEDIQSIIKSLFEARDFVFSNRKEAIEIMAKAGNMEGEIMAAAVDGIFLPDLKTNFEVMQKDGDESIYIVGRKIAEFYLEREVISEFPNFDEIIEDKFVNALANE